MFHFTIFVICCLLSFDNTANATMDEPTVVSIITKGLTQTIPADLIHTVDDSAQSKRLRDKGLSLEPSTGIVRINITKDFKLRGWKISNRLYFGQAKIAGIWGLGFILNRGKLSYGINNAGISVILLF